jgi:hypothetical protein
VDARAMQPEPARLGADGGVGVVGDRQVGLPRVAQRDS